MGAGRKMVYKIIELAINKGLQDMQEDLQRGVRRLVDLGSVFATGNHQRDFLRKAKNIFKDKNSPYFAVLSFLINNVDPKIIKTCGLNLGYNSWTYGAAKIRTYNQAGMENIPWFLLFDFRPKTDTVLTSKEVSAILTAGQDIGIYCGLFFIRQESYLETLIPTLSEHRDNTFLLFVPAELITARLAAIIAEAANIVIVLETSTANDNRQNKNAADAAEHLLKKKCLYGAYVFYNDHNLDYIMAHSYSKQIEELQCPFAFLIQENNDLGQKEQQFDAFLQQARELVPNNLFLFDFYQDLAYVNRLISAKAPFLAIKPDGTIAFNGSDSLGPYLNLKSGSLPEILQKLDS